MFFHILSNRVLALPFSHWAKAGPTLTDETICPASGLPDNQRVPPDTLTEELKT